MASTIAAVTTGGGGVITTADSSGNLSLLSGATTVVAVTSTGATVTGTLAVSGTGALTLPVGTTAQRPTPVTGMQRFNSSFGVTEVYNGTAWILNTSPLSVDYLVIAGGGSGGSYTAVSAYLSGNLGSNSTFASFTATGGGKGGTYNNIAGGTGGSGGGGEKWDKDHPKESVHWQHRGRRRSNRL